MTEPVLQPRPLESELFGQTIYACAVTTAADVEAALSAARSLSPVLLVFRAPAASLAAMQVVEAAGGRICDILLTYARAIDVDAADALSPLLGTKIRPGGAADSEAVRAVAARAFRDF